jgi:hypothetical protein
MTALPRGLMVLGFMGIAVAGFCGGNEGVRKETIAQGRAAGENDENYKVRKYAKWAYEQIFGEKF